MRRTITILSLCLLWAGCTKNNPVAPVTDTLQSSGLKVTFSIPRASYGVHDTLVATTTAYNPGDTTVSFDVPVCWPIAWYSVEDSTGTARLGWSAPRDLTCNSIIGYSIPPHQSKSVPFMDVVVPIADLDGTRAAQGKYTLTVDNDFGIFSLKFTVY